MPPKGKGKSAPVLKVEIPEELKVSGALSGEIEPKRLSSKRERISEVSPERTGLQPDLKRQRIRGRPIAPLLKKRLTVPNVIEVFRQNGYEVTKRDSGTGKTLVITKDGQPIVQRHFKNNGELLKILVEEQAPVLQVTLPQHWVESATKIAAPPRSSVVLEPVTASAIIDRTIVDTSEEQRDNLTPVVTTAADSVQDEEPQTDIREDLKPTVIAPVDDAQVPVSTEEYTSETPLVEGDGVYAQPVNQENSDPTGGNDLPPRLELTETVVTPYFDESALVLAVQEPIYSNGYVPSFDAGAYFYQQNVAVQNNVNQQEQNVLHYTQQTLIQQGVDPIAVTQGMNLIAERLANDSANVQRAQEDLLKGIQVLSAVEPLTANDIKSVASVIVQEVTDSVNNRVAQSTAEQINALKNLKVASGDTPPPNGMPMGNTDALLSKMLRVLTIANADKIRKQDLRENQISPRAEKAPVRFAPKPMATVNLPTRPVLRKPLVLVPRWS